mgnify:CR=1 FL=1
MAEEKNQSKEHFHVFESKEKDKDIVHYDICILGGGPAGLTSAIYSARYGLHTALITKDIGGMANLAHKIENYPGFEGSGTELMEKFYKQAKSFKAEFLNAEVSNIEKDKTGFVIYLTDNKVVHSKTIILALGTEKKKLGIENEEKFLGKGVSYCSSCDAYFFKNKIVAVLGSGDSACHSSLLLSGLAKKVYLITRGNELKCQLIDKEKMKHERIEILFNSRIGKINGKEKVEEVVLDSGKELKIDGLFIEIGATPLTSIIKKLNIRTDKDNYVIVNENMETNVKGVFAAGDAIKSKLKQVVVAASQGAIAAKSAFDEIKG